MSVGQAWRQLGLDPCHDERAVKRAYAARLKEIDPDTDVEGFSRLRAALSIARADAQRRGAMRETIGHGEAVDVGTGASAPSNPESALEAIASPEPAPDPAKPFVDAIVRNLFPQPGQRSDPAALVGAVTALLEDPRMEQFDFAGETEEWLASTALRAIPLSDPIVVMLADRFKWEAQLDRAHPNRLLFAAAQRSNDLRCIGVLSDPDHRWHNAWQALSVPKGGRPGLPDRLRLSPSVTELISSLGYNNPSVLQQCDPETVEYWAQAVKGSASADIVPANGISWFAWLAIGWLAMTVLARVASAFGQ
ncbi:MAG: hypothetical protein J7496_15985 [Novosphingobium sp.]|nr:hypothetical protein [Novosphingobium sp.]MBO9604002.1 hypothetical protein [Novosphingobium sp.]